MCNEELQARWAREVINVLFKKKTALALDKFSNCNKEFSKFGYNVCTEYDYTNKLPHTHNHMLTTNNELLQVKWEP